MSARKKIAVNTRFLINEKLEGIGTFSHQILQRLVYLLPNYEFHFLFDRPWNSKYVYNKNVHPHQLNPPARHPFLWYYWFEFSLNNWLKKNKCDLFFSPDSFLSLKNNTPSLLVMHDIAFEHFENHLPFLVQKYYQYFFPKYAKKATEIITVSEFTKKDIIEQYTISKDKISTVHCGVSSDYFSLDDVQKKNIRSTETAGLPYFLCVGSINPRKNLSMVLKSFDVFKEKNKSNHKLIIVGAKGWKTANFFEIYNSMNFKKDVIFKGHLVPEDLNNLMNAAEALVFPSLFEGFGIPIVEAFKAATPVITSNRSSMPEVAGDAAILVNPESKNNIVEAMEKLMNSENRKELIELGKKQANKFNWNKSAEQIAAKIEKMIEHN